jgi:transposase
MRKIHEILRLHFEQKLGQRQIARSANVSQSTVHEYLARMNAAGLRWPLDQEWDEDRLEEALFPPGQAVAKVPLRAQPDFVHIRQQLEQHRDLTVELLWEEYREQHPDGYCYSRFCKLYRRWKKHQDVVLRQDHRPGEKLFLDWAGATIPIHHRDGSVTQAPLFVSALGVSSYTYAEAVTDQQMANWLKVQMNALEFYDGCPQLLIPDNTKTGVTRACIYEPDLNPTYQEFAIHYRVAVMPTRPRKPRDKAYVSYCTSSRLCNGEPWLLGSSASLAFENRTFFERFVETAADIVVTVLSQSALSGPKVDCRGGHSVPRAHLFCGEQALGAQTAVAALQIEGLPDMRNLLQVERFILPRPPTLSVQNFCDLAIAVLFQQCVDLSHHLRLCFPNLSDRQWLGQGKASSGAAAETHVNLDRLSID